MRFVQHFTLPSAVTEEQISPLVLRIEDPRIGFLARMFLQRISTSCIENIDKSYSKESSRYREFHGL